MQEGFGEDPHHVAAFAGSGRWAAGRAARRLPRRDLVQLRPGRVHAIAKHFVGYGALAGGLSGGASVAHERALMEDHLRPWRAFVAAGGAGAMAGHPPPSVCRCTHMLRCSRACSRASSASAVVLSDCNDIGTLVAFDRANLTAAAALAARGSRPRPAVRPGYTSPVLRMQHRPPRRLGPSLALSVAPTPPPCCIERPLASSSTQRDATLQFASVVSRPPRGYSSSRWSRQSSRRTTSDV